MSAEEYDDYKGSVSVPSSFERIIGYHVHDSAGSNVGKVHNLWIDDTAQPLFLGVKTGWLFGKNHVVPLQNADVNDVRQVVRLPFTEEQIKGAPAFDESSDIEDADQQRIFSYYQVSRSSTAATERPSPQLEARETPASVREEIMETVQPAIEQRPATTSEQTLQLKEEEVKIGKRQVEAGGVRLRKIIRTETVNQPVELQREEIVIERVPTSGATAPGDQQFGSEDIYIPLRREEPVVQKTARVAEEVHVGKKIDVERQQVSEQVRREDLEVEKSGEA